MGGEGSGRRPDPVKALMGFNQPAPTDGALMYIPNTSFVKPEALVTNAKTGWVYANDGTAYYLNGNVGIGASSASNGLDIQTAYSQLILGKAASAGSMVFRRGSDGVTAAQVGWNGTSEGSIFLIQDSSGGGELRLQASSATGKVTLWGGSTQTVTVNSGSLTVLGSLTAGANGGLSLTDDTANSYIDAVSNHLLFRTTRAQDNIIFQENSAEAMRIISGGLVGIGTTAPSTLLHISGGAFTISNTTAPSTPASAGAIFVSGGECWYIGSSGTQTRLAVA